MVVSLWIITGWSESQRLGFVDFSLVVPLSAQSFQLGRNSRTVGRETAKMKSTKRILWPPWSPCIVPVRRPLVLRQLWNHHRRVSTAFLWALSLRVHLVHVDGQVGVGVPFGAALLTDDGPLLLPIILTALHLCLLFCYCWNRHHFFRLILQNFDQGWRSSWVNSSHAKTRVRYSDSFTTYYMSQILESARVNLELNSIRVKKYDSSNSPCGLSSSPCVLLLWWSMCAGTGDE